MTRSSKSSHPKGELPGQPWQLQTAKAQFSELFRRARTEGPQVVIRGREQVVVVAAEQFARLTMRGRWPQSLVTFFAESPPAQVSLNLRRDSDPGREIGLPNYISQRPGVR